MHQASHDPSHFFPAGPLPDPDPIGSECSSPTFPPLPSSSSTAPAPAALVQVVEACPHLVDVPVTLGVDEARDTHTHPMPSRWNPEVNCFLDHTTTAVRRLEDSTSMTEEEQVDEDGEDAEIVSMMSDRTLSRKPVSPVEADPTDPSTDSRLTIPDGLPSVQDPSRPTRAAEGYVRAPLPALSCDPTCLPRCRPAQDHMEPVGSIEGSPDRASMPPTERHSRADRVRRR